MAKTIGVLLSLKDQFTTPLQKATKSVKTMDRQLEKAGNQIKAFGNRVKAGMKSVAKWAAIGFGALTAAAGVFIKQSIDAAKDKLKADKLLETNLMKQANFKKEHIQMLKDEASALQDVGVVGDDVAVAGAGQLAIYKLKAEQIKTILPVIDDMVAKEKRFNGTQEDAIAMADVFGKAVEGKTKGLVKYGVSLTDAEEKLFKTMKREQRAEFLNKKLTAAIGGTNKALRETDEGKIVAAKGAWGDMQAELGKKLMPKLGAIAEWFHSKIPGIQDFILSLADKVEELVTKAEPYITQIKDMFGKIFEKVKPAIFEAWEILKSFVASAIDIAQKIIANWDRISPVVYTVIGALATYKAVMIAMKVYTVAMITVTKIKLALDAAQATATTALTIKQKILNATLKANPIGFVITAIATLVAVIWTAYKNWDKISKWLQDAWAKIKEVIKAVVDVLVGVFMPIWDAVCNIINFGKNVILSICNVISGIFIEIIKGAIKAWDGFKNAISKVCDFITGVFMSVWDSLMKALDAILHPIETAKKAFGGLIDKLKFWNNTKAEDKTININEKTTKTNEAIGGSNKTGTSNVTVKNPRHALGTAYFKGGTTGINEGGRDETAILPAGTQILSHEEGKSLQKNNTEKQVIIKEVESKKSSDKKIELHIHIAGNFIGEKEHMEKYGEYTANKILAALNNM